MNVIQPCKPFGSAGQPRTPARLAGCRRGTSRKFRFQGPPEDRILAVMLPQRLIGVQFTVALLAILLSLSEICNAANPEIPEKIRKSDLVIKAELKDGKWVSTVLKRKDKPDLKREKQMTDRIEGHGRLRERMGLRNLEFYLVLLSAGGNQEYMMFNCVDGKVKFPREDSIRSMEASEFEKEISGK